MPPLRIALAQIAPRLGLLDENLARHHALLEDAREEGAGLVVFPELGLTGYLLQDLAADVAMRLDDPRLTELVAATRGLSAIVSFVEESADHRLFIAAALLEDGRLRHVHRKLFLPTYGLFDERRFFAAGDMLRAVPSRLGGGIGLAICEDFWHLSAPHLLALDGAQLLVNVSSSPGRDLAATNAVGLGTATSWRTLMRTYAQLTTSVVVFCNRVGVDESISFWGGSEVISPAGRALFSAPLWDEGLFTVDVDLGDIRRERIALPLLRDERQGDPLAADVPQVDVDREQALVPERRAEQRPARRRDDFRAAPEADRLIHADPIAEDDHTRGQLSVGPHERPPGRGGAQADLVGRRPVTAGRRGDVDQELRPVQGEKVWRRQVPEVLADRQADADPEPRRHRAQHVAGGEESALVEEAICRQEHLAVDVAQAAVLEEGRRNEQTVVGRLLHERDDRRQAPGRRHELGESGVVESHRDVGRQVLQQVAGEPELREDDEPGALLARVLEQRMMAGEVLVEEPQAWRDLGQGDPERRHAGSLARLRRSSRAGLGWRDAGERIMRFTHHIQDSRA